MQQTHTRAHTHAHTLTVVLLTAGKTAQSARYDKSRGNRRNGYKIQGVGSTAATGCSALQRLALDGD